MSSRTYWKTARSPLGPSSLPRLRGRIAFSFSALETPRSNRKPMLLLREMLQPPIVGRNHQRFVAELPVGDTVLSLDHPFGHVSLEIRFLASRPSGVPPVRPDSPSRMIGKLRPTGMVHRIGILERPPTSNLHRNRQLAGDPWKNCHPRLKELI